MWRFACAVAAAVVLAGCGRTSANPAVASAPAAPPVAGSSSWAPASAVAGASSSAAVLAPAPAVSVGMATTMHGTVTGTPPPALSGGLAFATPQEGLAALRAGGVLGTSDGGRSWGVLDPGGPRFQYLTYPAAGRAYGLTFGHVLWATADGGHTWTQVRAFTPSTAAFSQGLDFTSADVGWVAVGATLYTTADGGSHWATHAAPCPAGFSSPVPGGASLAFATARKGWAFAGAAGSWETTDGGETWRPAVGWMPAPTFGGFAGGARGWAVGVDDCAAGACTGDVLLSTDGGSAWRAIAFAPPTSQAAPSFVGCTALDFPTPHVGYAVLDGLLYHSADGGVTWRLLADPLGGN